MIQLDIVTPVSRPWNLAAIAPGVRAGEALFDLRWYLVHDCGTGSCDGAMVERHSPWVAHVKDPDSEAGWAQRIWHLEHGRPNAFVWWLDDDGMVHPDFFPALHADLTVKDNADRTPLAALYSMSYPHMTNGQVLVADPNGMFVSGVSGSMIVFHRSTVGALRPAKKRTADGSFIRDWWYKAPHNRVTFNQRPLILFNPLDPTRPE